MVLKIGRRSFLKVAGSLGAAIFGYFFLSHFLNTRKYSSDDSNIEGNAESDSQFNKITAMISPDNRVIAVHDPSATNWNFSNGWYGDYVNQEIVDMMIDRGLLELTGESKIELAWKRLIKNYSSGKKIAIKVNFNNCLKYNDSHNRIDALIHPINSIIKGLRTIGVQEDDIWIYDASRPIPDRFINGCTYKNVIFYDSLGKQGRKLATFEDSSPDSFIEFTNPEIGPHKLTDVLVYSDYIINIPIIKQHRSGTGVTLSMKNHLGSLNKISDLHDFILLGKKKYNSSQNPLVDINNNFHILNKTVLIIGDGLFGNWHNNYAEFYRWRTFNNDALNTLFFSRNAVAIDSVMYDLLKAETSIDKRAEDYLHIAAGKGMGIHDHMSKSNTYDLIDYIYIDLNN